MDSSPDIGTKGSLDRRIQAASARLRSEALTEEFYTLAETQGAVAAAFACLMRNMTEARFTVRAPDRTVPRGYRYEWVPDGAVQLTAARLMAQVLRLMPVAGSVTVDARTQTVNVTATERLAELDSLGVPREMVARACEDLLKVASTPAESDRQADLQKGGG